MNNRPQSQENTQSLSEKRIAEQKAMNEAIDNLHFHLRQKKGRTPSHIAELEESFRYTLKEFAWEMHTLERYFHNKPINSARSVFNKSTNSQGIKTHFDSLLELLVEILSIRREKERSHPRAQRMGVKHIMARPLNQVCESLLSTLNKKDIPETLHIVIHELIRGLFFANQIALAKELVRFEISIFTQGSEILNVLQLPTGQYTKENTATFFEHYDHLQDYSDLLTNLHEYSPQIRTIVEGFPQVAHKLSDHERAKVFLETDNEFASLPSMVQWFQTQKEYKMSRSSSNYAGYRRFPLLQHFFPKIYREGYVELSTEAEASIEQTIQSFQFSTALALRESAEIRNLYNECTRLRNLDKVYELFKVEHQDIRDTLFIDDVEAGSPLMVYFPTQEYGNLNGKDILFEFILLSNDEVFLETLLQRKNVQIQRNRSGRGSIAQAKILREFQGAIARLRNNRELYDIPECHAPNTDFIAPMAKFGISKFGPELVAAEHGFVSLSRILDQSDYGNIGRGIVGLAMEKLLDHLHALDKKIGGTAHSPKAIKKSPAQILSEMKEAISRYTLPVLSAAEFEKTLSQIGVDFSQGKGDHLKGVTGSTGLQSKKAKGRVRPLTLDTGRNHYYPGIIHTSLQSSGIPTELFWAVYYKELDQRAAQELLESL